MTKVFIVYCEESDEGVVFGSKEDAKYAATGIESGILPGVSSLADSWRQQFAEDNQQFEVKEVEI